MFVTLQFKATKSASGGDLQANTMYNIYLFAVNPNDSSDFTYVSLEGVATGII